MKEYGVKFFELEDGEESEIDMDVLPDEIGRASCRERV